MTNFFQFLKVANRNSGGDILKYFAITAAVIINTILIMNGYVLLNENPKGPILIFYILGFVINSLVALLFTIIVLFIFLLVTHIWQAIKSTIMPSFERARDEVYGNPKTKPTKAKVEFQ